MPKIRIPTSLRKHTGGESTADVDAASVGDALNRLVDQHSALRSQLFGEDGGVVSYINVFVNDRSIRDLRGLETTVQSGDEVLIVPALAGG